MSEITVGQLGAGFIGKVHSHAYSVAGTSLHRPADRVTLALLAEKDERLCAETAEQFGWQSTTNDWRDVVSAPEVMLFDNSGPNAVHGEPSMQAASNGKHVLCEKPLASSADEALEIYRHIAATGVLHQCAFMYRFIPAIRHARELIQGGELGEILHVRARFLMSFASDASIPMSWRFDKSLAGAGALGDLGSHHIDLARFLAGEVHSCASLTHTFFEDRPGGRVTNDDCFLAIARLDGGATASFEASRVAGNHTLTSHVEVDGTQGSLSFDFERLNELRVSIRGHRGFRTYLATEADHPFSDFLFPVGIQGQHPIGWDLCFSHQALAMLNAIESGDPLPEPIATLRDGYRVAEVVETIERAAASGRWEDVNYRDKGEE